MAEQAMQNKKLGVTQEYDRTLYDDPKIRQYTHDMYFGDNKIIEGPKGEVLHRDHAAAKNKYGAKRASYHQAEADHIDPLKNIHERHKNNPFLTDDDIKEVGNRLSNMQELNKHDNGPAGKGKKSEFQIGLQERDISRVIKGTEARMETDARLAGRSVKNAVGLVVPESDVLDAGVEAVKHAEVELILVGAQNLIAVLNEEKTEAEAIKDTAVAVGSVAATGMVDELVFGGAGVAPQVVAVAHVMKDSFMKYLNDEISEEEFVNEVVQKSIPLIAGKIAGVATGGNLLAQMVVTYTCTLICNEIQTVISDYKSIERMRSDYLSRINRVSREMTEELKTQRAYLRIAFENSAIEWNQKTDQGFRLIEKGVLDNNMADVVSGLDSIMGLFGTKSEYRNANDVRKFFASSDRVIKL